MYLQRQNKENAQQAVAGIEVVSLLLEMPLDVFHGPMLPGDPGESFRAESGCLGDSLPVSRRIGFPCSSVMIFPLGVVTPVLGHSQGLQDRLDENRRGELRQP